MIDSSVRAKPPGSGVPPLGGSPKGGVVLMNAAAFGRGATNIGRGVATRRVREAVDADARKNVRESMLNN